MQSEDFQDGFELVLPGATPDSPDWTGDSYPEGFLETVERDISVALATDNVAARETTTGYGAESLAVAVVLAGFSALLLNGKRIKDNLDAWIELGRRLRSSLPSIGERFGGTRVSEPAALAIALDAVASFEEDVPSAVLIASIVSKIPNGVLSPRAFDTFATHPDRYYVFTIRVGRRSEHVVGVASTGKVLFHHCLPLSYMEFPGPSTLSSRDDG